MTEHSPDSAFRQHFARLLEEAGFIIRQWSVTSVPEPVVLAENPYYLIAFQVFEDWNTLARSAQSMELELSDLIGRVPATNKVWDAYLVLVCRSELRTVDEYNEFSQLMYDVRRTRKIVRAGVGDSLTKVDGVLSPFLTLKRVQIASKGRDPLETLRQKMVERGEHGAELARLISMFRERGRLDDGQL